MDYRLFSWGANNFGQLGIGQLCEQCNNLTEVLPSGTLSFDEITTIKGGGGHTLILDRHGKVYGCGLNTSHQLGTIGSENMLRFQELKCLNGYNVTQIACGWDFSFAVTKEGHLLGWGSNNYGQLGISHDKIRKVQIPVLLPLDTFVKQVACGLRHTIILLENGKIMVAGQGRKGQLGIVDNGRPLLQTDTFKEVCNLKNVKMVACGQSHSLALTAEGKLYVWGNNKYGQLGCDPLAYPSVNVPMMMSSVIDSSNITTVQSGWTHSVFVTDDGVIINNGRNCYGQLGSVKEERLNVWTPRKITLHKNIRQLAVGSEHNIVLTDNNEVWSWGWNEHGNCGLGNEVNIFTPTQIAVKQTPVLIGTGSAHSFVLTKT